MEDFSNSEEGRQALIEGTCRFLLTSLDAGMKTVAEELLQQGLVLLWSALEVLFRDTFEALLNADATKVRILLSHPKTKKRLEVEKLPLEILAQHGFDVSKHLGTVVVSQQDFSDLPTIKAIYGVLFSANTKLSTALASSDLWRLFQQRHLVVHRRGIIDKTYCEVTGTSVSSIGSRLVVQPSEFESALTTVITAGAALAEALRVTL